MNCLICKKKSKIKYKYVINIYDKKKYQINYCEKCNLGFTINNINKNNEQFYSNIYDYNTNIVIKKEKLWRIEKNFNKIKNLINLSQKSCILDIGCMYGFFLSHIQKNTIVLVTDWKLKTLN